MVYIIWKSSIIFFALPFCPLPLVLLLILICKPNVSVLMQSIREDFEKEHPAIQSSDIIMFFRVAQFVISFQYHKIVSSKVRVTGSHILRILIFVLR